MKRLLLAAAILCGFAAPALAICPTPLTGKDAAGTTQNLSTTLDAAGSCAADIVILDSAGTNKATVNASGQLSVVQPAGFATSALQTTGNTALTTINTTLGTPMQNSGGSVTANAGTNLNTSALATSANQTNASQKTQIVDGSGNVIASTSNNLNVQCANCSGSGASAADAATFTAGTSTFAPAGGQFTSGGATACVTGHQCLVGITAARGFLTDTSTVNGVTVLTGTGAVGTGAQRVAVGTDTATIAGSAPGTAGSASTNVLTVQGITSMTALTVAQATGSNLHVVCDSGCSGSGGTSSADAATWTAGTTVATQIAGEYTSTGATACVTAHSCTVAITTDRSLFANMADWAGTALGAPSTYGTSPGAVNVPGVNAFVTNANANGSATSANSSPVVIASDQAAVAVKAASGAIASGAVASGAYAAGSIAAGAYVSGSLLSGALASGAVVDITNMSVSTGSAPPSKAIYLGANASGATGGQVAGLVTCDKHVFKHITTATDTLAVQGVASQTIRICGWRSRAAGTATWFLENTASANANCSSSNTQITGVASEVANSGETLLAPFWTGLANTSGNGLCINSTGTGGVDVDIWYNQF